MPAPKNLIHENSASTGTGNLTLSAVNGKVRFSDATYGFGTGGSNVFDYFISNREAAEWERGTGSMSDANTLVRDTVIHSSNSNNAVDFSAGTKDVTNDAPAETQPCLQGHIFGLTLSNAADTANDITIAAGQATDEAGEWVMSLSSAVTKQLDAAWAVGTNAGGLNTGAEANSTWYEVILIGRRDTGVVDVMFSTTANRATLPTNYTHKRRIGWIRNDGAGSILQFTQVDDYFTLTTQINDVAATMTSTAAAVTVTVPPSCIGRFRMGTTAGTGGTNLADQTTVFSEIVEGNVTPTVTTGISSVSTMEVSAGTVATDAGHMELRVSSTSTIEHDGSANANTGGGTFDISTFGWIDTRRRLSAT